jgi:hypothetical protein
MSGSFLDVVRSLDDQTLCVKHYCTTCGCEALRAVLAQFPCLADQLTRLAPEELRFATKKWSECLYWALRALSIPDFDRVLQAWTPSLREHVWFADHVLFYSVTDFSTSARRGFLDTCIRIAIESNYISLIETIVWRLDSGLREYPDFLQHALQISRHSGLVYHALGEAGFVRPTREIEAEMQSRAKMSRQSQVAVKKLFPAIRRNDIKAVEALLQMRPDLSTTNDEGLTAEEYARECGRDAVLRILQSSGDKQ